MCAEQGGALQDLLRSFPILCFFPMSLYLWIWINAIFTYVNPSLPKEEDLGVSQYSHTARQGSTWDCDEKGLLLWNNLEVINCSFRWSCGLVSHIYASILPSRYPGVTPSLLETSRSLPSFPPPFPRNFWTSDIFCLSKPMVHFCESFCFWQITVFPRNTASFPNLFQSTAGEKIYGFLCVKKPRRTLDFTLM